MAGKDLELQRLGNELDNAQRAIDAAKVRLDQIAPRRANIKSQIEGVNYRIADTRRMVQSEYDSMKLCYQARNKYDAENHRYRAQSFKEGLQREYDLKNGLYSELNMIKVDFDSALAALRDAKDRKAQIREQFNARLAAVKANNEAERAKWKTTSCKCCGAQVRYHVEWTRIPDLCKTCADREKAKWKDISCRCCGTTVRYNVEWTRIPDLCKTCAAREKAKWKDTTCRKCGKTLRYNSEWQHIPTICKDCKAKGRWQSCAV